MSAYSELMCSQLLVPLAGLTSRGQTRLSCSLGKGGLGKLRVSALQWQGCRRGRWCRFSVCPSSFCLTFSITSCSWNHLRFTRMLKEEIKLSPSEWGFFLLWCCLAFVFAPFVAYVAFLHPTDCKGFLLRLTLQSTGNGSKLEGDVCV